MLTLPETYKQDYLRLYPLKNFCNMHNLHTSESKPDLINSILAYAGDDINSENYKITQNWILQSIFDSCNEICYKKIYIRDDIYLETHVKEVIENTFKECKKSDLLNCSSNSELSLVDYLVTLDDMSNVNKVKFTFVRTVLEGNAGETGSQIIYPLFIELYVKEGFIVSRCKAKATIYDNTDDGSIKRDKKIITTNFATGVMNKIIKIFNLSEDSVSVAKNKVGSLLYKLYSKYSFTPREVTEQIGTIEDDIKRFLRVFFDKLKLNISNIPSAYEDLHIFAEKYISINGQFEKVFKEDREAYLVKITSDDTSDSTKIDTTSALTKPLQCTPVFFDSKKSVTKNMQCKKLHLCYNRRRDYLGSYLIQFSFKSNYGILKTYYYPEECDVQNVLQTVFSIY